MKLGSKLKVVNNLKPLVNRSQICYLKTNEHVRVGRRDWPGDVFITVAPEEWASFEKIMEGLSIQMHDWEEDHDDA